MADYNRRWRHPSRDRDWEHFRDRYEQENDYDRYRNYSDDYGDVGYDRNRSDYGSHDYDSDYNRHHYRYGDRSRRDNEYGSYNAGYSDEGYKRNRNREEDHPDSMYHGPYGAGGNYGSFGGITSNRIPPDREEDRHRRTDYERDRGGRHERTWWDRTADEISSWFGDDNAQRRRRIDKVSGPHRGKGPKGYSRSDERILEDINDRLSDDPYVDASDIEVRVNNGEVTLSGNSHNKEAKRRAEDIAESVSGVRDVENHIKVSHSTASVGSSTVYSNEDSRTTRRHRNNWL